MKKKKVYEFMSVELELRELHKFVSNRMIMFSSIIWEA